MKVILNLDDETVHNLQGYCRQNDLSQDEVITSLFNQYIQSPASYIDELYAKGELGDFYRFKSDLMSSLNEVIINTYDVANSPEAYDDDMQMAEVYKMLNRDIVKQAFVLTELHKAYKGGGKK